MTLFRGASMALFLDVEHRVNDHRKLVEAPGGILGQPEATSGNHGVETDIV